MKNIVALILISTLLPGFAWAKKDAGEGQPQQNHDAHQRGLPKGLEKKVARGEPLPPGWEKKVHKGAVLDDDIIAHGEPVPDSIKVKLPVGDKGSIEFKIENKVIRLDEITKTVIDVFDI